MAKKIGFSPDVVQKGTYLNDVRFDLKLGPDGVAFMTDSGKDGNGIIVTDLASGQSFRRLTGHRTVLPDPNFHPIVEGRPLMEEKTPGDRRPFQVGSDGIAVSADGERVFYTPLCSQRLYSVDAATLADRSKSEAEVEATIQDLGDKGTGADGLETDDQGRLYITSPEHNAILRRLPDGQYEGVVHDPRLLWPDSLAISTDDYLYITVNQLERAPRFHGGKDLRKKPWVLFRVPIGAGPSLLTQPQR
jgi:sugar lactone lactonase YvrE